MLDAVRRVRDSIAYRSSLPCRLILASLPPSRVPAKPPVDVTYLTFAGEAYLAMLRESVASLANAWDRLPRIRVVGDGTVPPERLQRTLAFLPSAPEIVDWRDLIAPLREKGYASIVRFAERVPMARKLVAVVATALAGPTIYADVDVLWFRFPSALLSVTSFANPQLIMSPDFQSSYDPDLVPGELPHLAKPPFYCAGILFAGGDFLRACNVEHLLERAAETGVALTEQTILAEANHQLGRGARPASEFFLDDQDRFTLGPSYVGKAWVARHYVGHVRHLFWRDALALRAGLGREANPSGA